jgi:hypothetical protein
MNPTLRGFLLIAVVVAIVYVLQLEQTLVALTILLRIAFFLAIAFFVYMWWRDRRSDISTWPARAQVVFYGAALVMVVNVAARILFLTGGGGLDWIAFVLVFVLCGFAMWRVWRDQHTYGY